MNGNHCPQIIGESQSASPHCDKRSEGILGLMASGVSVRGHLTLSLETVTAQCVTAGKQEGGRRLTSRQPGSEIREK